MGQPSLPVLPPISSPPPPPPLPAVSQGECQVRCGGCKVILQVRAGLKEFVCPAPTCQLLQMLPPELVQQQQHKAPGIDPSKIQQLPCSHCKAILNVPHGLSRFTCPQCGLHLALDLSTIPHFSPPPPPPPEEVNELAIEVEREEDEGGLVGETFMDYRPSKLSIGPPHPDPIVETSSLSAVQPPEPSYHLKIKDKLETSKALSCLQIETLVYAGQRHLQRLPDGSRAGFFIGDGAGVGKGRTIAGLIWENWHHRRRKALWISVGSDLKFDARRDLDDVGAMRIKVHALNKLPYSKLDSKSIGIREGVVFLTYSTLIASSEKGRSRLQQLVQWCAPEFDGLIIFDECHKAKNLVPEAGGQPTRTGKAVLEIQAQLPQARIVYCSATGASEPRNMGYMVRLGLWGAGTSFINFRDFLGSMEKGGVGALELVAMDMKARGMYVSRTLSYKSAEFEVVEVPLEAKMMMLCQLVFRLSCEELGNGPPNPLGQKRLAPTVLLLKQYMPFPRSPPSDISSSEMVMRNTIAESIALLLTVKDMYINAAEFWAKLKVDLLSASAFLTNEKPSSSQLWRLYWANHQRFFRYLCMAAKIPALVRLSKQALMENKCVVIGLQSTGEARTEEAVSKYGLELDDFISGPRELLLKFVEENYPLPEKPEPLPDDSVKELQRKRDSATVGVSFRGRVRKVAKCQDGTDEESYEESESKTSDESYEESERDSEPESTESDDEFEFCNICNLEEERKKLLQCSSCGQLIHPECVSPTFEEAVPGDWSCPSCEEKTDEYLQAKHAHVAEQLKRYEGSLELKSKILETICSLDLPNNPLDDIIDQLGGPDRVAEITGRRGMLVRATGGKGVTYQARNTKDVTMEMVNMHEKQLFMDGKKLIAIISEAGSAGVSLQADRRALNQKRRVHLTLELPWSADRAIQQFGRTHRSNQASAPEYRLLFTNLGGERRFASIVAKRLESLGALTQGDRRAGPSLNAYNYDSAHGKRALMMLYRGIMEQDVLPVVPPGCSSENPDAIEDFIVKGKAALVSVGIIRDSVLGNGKDSGKISGHIVDSDMHDVGRFLNRLLGLPPNIQNRLFGLFVSILDLLIENARIEGNLDSGIVDMRANTIELHGTPKTVHVDNMSGASTVLFTFTLDRGIVWESASALLKDKQKDESASSNNGFYESRREWLGRRHFLLAFEGSAPRVYKIYRPAVGEALRGMPLAELKDKYRKISSIEKARSGWKDEYEVSSKQCMHGPNCKLGNFCTVGRRLQEVNVLGGSILPVWGTIEKALSKQARQSHKRIRIVSLETTTDNQRIVGLLIPNAAVESVLQDLACAQDNDD